MFLFISFLVILFILYKFVLVYKIKYKIKIMSLIFLFIFIFNIFVDLSLVKVYAYNSIDNNSVYLEIDDVETHKKVLQFMLDNHLIPKTKSGKLKNISFKLDEQTGNGEYKEKFKAKLKLENFIDLETEKWIKKDNSW